MDLSTLSLPQILVRLTLVPMAIAAVIGVVRFRHLPVNLRWLTGLILFLLPLSTLGFMLMLQRQNNLFIMPIYTAGEFALLALVYGHTLQSGTFNRVVPWLVGAFAAYVLFDSLYPANLTVYRPGQQVVQALLVLCFTLLYFRKLLRELRATYLWQDPMFWVSAGLLLYFLGYIQIALFSNFLLHYSQEFAQLVWAIHSCLFIILYGCYSLALCLPPRK
jgi:hypothetical protein